MPVYANVTVSVNACGLCWTAAFVPMSTVCVRAPFACGAVSVYVRILQSALPARVNAPAAELTAPTTLGLRLVHGPATTLAVSGKPVGPVSATATLFSVTEGPVIVQPAPGIEHRFEVTAR